MLAEVITIVGGIEYIQVNFQVPMERNVSLPNLGAFSGFMQTCGGLVTPLPGWQIGGFYSDANDYALAQHASDHSPVTVDNPAHPGESIIAYGNDIFPVWPSPPIGYAAPSQPLFQLDPTGGQWFAGYLYLQDYIIPGQFDGLQPPSTPPIQTTFMGMAPGMVGTQQVNFVVPANQQPGTWRLFFDTGCPPGVTGAYGCASRPTATPAVLLPVR